MSIVAAGGLVILGLALILGIRYLASGQHEGGRNPGDTAEPFTRNDPGSGDPGHGH